MLNANNLNSILLLSSNSGFWSKLGFILLAVLILLMMVTIHEFGHYCAGKLLKFKINEFSVGFGKAIFSKTNKKTGEKFSLRIVPLGGYCAFDGEDENPDSPTGFNTQKPWKRLIVLFSGAFFNFLSAIIFSVILLCTVGNGIPRITSTVENNPNPIMAGDVILKVEGEKPTFFNGGIAGLLSQYYDKEEVHIVVQRDGKTQQLTLKPYEYDLNGEKVTGFGISAELVKYSFGTSLLKAVPFTFEMAWECLVLLFNLLIGKLSISSLGGPITTINAIASGTAQSWLNLVLFLPLIAVNLAVFNLLPIPALDGARMVFVLIEWIRKKPIKREIEAKIHFVGLVVLFAFVILVDVLQLLVFKQF